MSYDTCNHCGGPLFIAVEDEKGEIVDVLEPNCVAGDEMCHACWIRLLERLEKETKAREGQFPPIYIGPEERRYHSLDDGSSRPEEHGQEWEGYNEDDDGEDDEGATGGDGR